MNKIIFELKLVDMEKGEFEGMASVYDVEDAYGDVVQKGAFKRTLDHKHGKVPLLWQHNPSDVIGVAELKDDASGLIVKGRLNLAIGKAREAFELIKQGAVNGLSIGYDTVQESFENGLRMLKELRLWEVSVVTFPANPEALIASVKSDDKSFDSALATIIGMSKMEIKADSRNVKMAIRSLEALLVKASGLVGSDGSNDVHPNQPTDKPEPGASEVSEAKALVEKFVESLKQKRS